MIRDIKNVSLALNYRNAEILDIEWPSRRKLKTFNEDLNDINNISASIIKTKRDSKIRYIGKLGNY